LDSAAHIVALANDVTAGYWNPAGLARINYPEFSLMHDEQFGSLENFDYAALLFRLDRTIQPAQPLPTRMARAGRL